MLHRITSILFLSDEELSAAGSPWALVKNADAWVPHTGPTVSLGRARICIFNSPPGGSRLSYQL